MRKREAGQAFILVLIFLAIGALLVVPSLRLTGTALMNSPIVERQIKGLYAADAAQEYILWKLLWDDLAGDLMQSYNPEAPDPSAHYDLDVCGVPVGVTVCMRAEEGKGGTALATNDKIKPTKEVTPSYVEEKREELYTYTINLDYLSDISEDNPKVRLDAIYDLPPGGFGSGAYDEEYGSWLSLDGGNSWLPIPDPEWNAPKGYLKWPADYEWDPVVTGAFSSHPEFYGIEDFEEREVKKLRFQMRGTLGDNQVQCNWVVLKMDDEEHPNTLSGPQAPIKVGGDPDIPGECGGGGVLEVTKTSYPEIIPPGEPTVVTYTISVTNMDGRPHDIQQVIDYLPLYPEFNYIFDSVDPTSTLTPLEPLEAVPEEINGVWRERVRWTKDQFPGGIDRKIHSGETLTLTFQALATKDISGSYYNEVIVILKEVGIHGSAFEEAGVSPGEYGTGYSWNTGAVMVPAYDSSSEAEGITINANMALILGGITITSWQVD